MLWLLVVSLLPAGKKRSMERFLPVACHICYRWQWRRQSITEARWRSGKNANVWVPGRQHRQTCKQQLSIVGMDGVRRRRPSLRSKFAFGDECFWQGDSATNHSSSLAFVYERFWLTLLWMRERTLGSDQLCVSTAELACDVKRSGLNTDHGAGDGCRRRVRVLSRTRINRPGFRRRPITAVLSRSSMKVSDWQRNILVTNCSMSNFSIHWLIFSIFFSSKPKTKIDKNKKNKRTGNRVTVLTR